MCSDVTDSESFGQRLRSHRTWELLLDAHTEQTQNICMTCVQRRPNVFDVGPTLYTCHTNVLCLLVYHDLIAIYQIGDRFTHPANTQHLYNIYTTSVMAEIVLNYRHGGKR